MLFRSDLIGHVARGFSATAFGHTVLELPKHSLITLTECLDSGGGVPERHVLELISRLRDVDAESLAVWAERRDGMAVAAPKFTREASSPPRDGARERGAWGQGRNGVVGETRKTRK